MQGASQLLHVQQRATHWAPTTNCTLDLFGSSGAPTAANDRLTMGLSQRTAKADTGIRNVYNLDDFDHLKVEFGGL